MSSLFNELKRRNVIKASAGYTLLGWLVLQIADVIVPAMKLPDWTMSFLLLVGLLGFPFVMFFSLSSCLTKFFSDICPTKLVK